MNRKLTIAVLLALPVLIQTSEDIEEPPAQKQLTVIQRRKLERRHLAVKAAEAGQKQHRRMRTKLADLTTIEWAEDLDSTVAEAQALGRMDGYAWTRDHLKSMLSAAAGGKLPALAQKRTTDLDNWMNRALDGASSNIKATYNTSAAQTQKTDDENFARTQASMQDLLTLLANAEGPHNDEKNHFRINAGTLRHLYAQLQTHVTGTREQAEEALLNARRNLAMNQKLMTCIIGLLPESERPKVDETLAVHAHDVSQLARDMGRSVMSRKLKEARDLAEAKAKAAKEAAAAKAKAAQEKAKAEQEAADAEAKAKAETLKAQKQTQLEELAAQKAAKGKGKGEDGDTTTPADATATGTLTAVTTDSSAGAVANAENDDDDDK